MSARDTPIPEGEAREVIGAFEGLRRAQTGGRYAPHKPLLVLLSLARVQRGEARMARFTELESDLRALLDEFGPTRSADRAHMPFWHLGTDHGGSLWELKGPRVLLARAAGATPTLGALRGVAVRGGFSGQIYERLSRDPSLLQDVARRVLRAYFPKSIHADILSAIGLDLDISDPARAPTQTIETDVTPRRRDPAFREKVLLAYEFRCCVCGFDLRIGRVPAGIEAAHIQWHHVGGPDVVQNGLALCSLHHKLFDLGVFCIETEGRRIVFSQHAIDGQRGLAGELRLHGRPMLPPQDPTFVPDERFLKWNWTNVFKRPERRVG